MLNSGTMFQLHTIQQMTTQEVLMLSSKMINQVNHRDGSKDLSQPEDQWPKQISAEVSEGDPEVKPAVAVNVITIK